MKTGRVGTIILGIALVASQAYAKDPLSRKMPDPPPAIPAPPPVVKMPLDLGLRETARVEIERAIKSSDPVSRANGVEALKTGVGASAAGLIETMLGDKDPLVRFASAMACGELRAKSARERLLKLTDDVDPNVQMAARFALHRLGDTRLSHDLEAFVQDPNPRIRANTVVALGLLGEKSAIPLLIPLQRDPAPAVRLQSYEALWRLGDQSGLNSLVAMSISRFPDDQIVAVLGLAAPRDQRVRQHVRGLLISDYEEVSLAAARAMGLLGSDEGYVIAGKAAVSQDPRQRALAAWALGAIRRSDTQPTLKKLLSDPEPQVRLAAATAVLSLR